jgi:anti-sigma B factor antagonist
MDLSIATVAFGRWSVVVVLGELDMSTAPALRSELRRLVNREVDGPTKAIAVDLDGVGFCDSIGLGILVGARRRVIEAHGDFALIVTSERLTRLLDITGLARVFTVVIDRSDLSQGSADSSPD